MGEIRHGHTVGGKKSSTYTIWRGMLRRCRNPARKDYPRYGGRGITVCDRWDDFSAFLEDMGERPPGLSLDRRDNDVGYCKENCYWATDKEQQSTRREGRRGVYLTHHGETKSMMEWTKARGFGVTLIRNRLKAGWSPEDAIGTPAGPRKKLYTKEGV